MKDLTKEQIREDFKPIVNYWKIQHQKLMEQMSDLLTDMDRLERMIKRYE